MAMTVSLGFAIQPEMAEEFKSLLREPPPETRAFEGCQRVEVYQGQDNPGEINLIKDWASKEHQQKD